LPTSLAVLKTRTNINNHKQAITDDRFVVLTATSCFVENRKYRSLILRCFWLAKDKKKTDYDLLIYRVSQLNPETLITALDVPDS